MASRSPPRGPAADRGRGRRDQDVRFDRKRRGRLGHQTFTFDEMKAAVERGAQGWVNGSPSIPMDRRERGTPCGPEPIRSSMRPTSTTRPSRRWCSGRHSTCPPSITTAITPSVASSSVTRRSREAAQCLHLHATSKPLRRAMKAGVRFAMGSDAVFTMFGQNTRELGWFVKAGMTPAEALATATTNAAVLLGNGEKPGRRRTGLLRRPRGRRRRSTGRHRCGDQQGSDGS